jgi:glutathione S-transferase
MESSGKPQLYYWNIRGLGSYICMAFFAAGKDFDLVEYGPDNEGDWFGKDKPSLAMTLPNLPYLKDGALEISEHDAIFKHVLRKYKPELLGSTIDEQAEVDQFISFWVKTNMNMRLWCYSDAAKVATDKDREAKVNEF